MQNTWNSENADNELNQQTRDLGFVGQTGAQSIKYFYMYYNLEKTQWGGNVCHNLQQKIINEQLTYLSGFSFKKLCTLWTV